jgi:hypothetical protein
MCAFETEMAATTDRLYDLREVYMARRNRNLGKSKRRQVLIDHSGCAGNDIFRFDSAYLLRECGGTQTRGGPPGADRVTNRYCVEYREL